MAFEVDFLAVGDGEKSGDAIAVRWGNLGGLTGPIFCTKWNVSVTPLLIFVRRSRRGCGDVTISEILDILKELQFPIERHQNPLGSVYTTVTRLMAEGEVVAGEPEGEKKTYRWSRTMLKIALMLKDSKKRAS